MFLYENVCWMCLFILQKFNWFGFVLLLSSYSLLIHVVWSIETVTSPSSQNPSWNIGLKSWLHRNPGLKATKTQRNKTKGAEGFTKCGLHSNLSLSKCNSTLMLRFLQLSMPVSIVLQRRFICCQYRSVIFVSKKNFLIWILVYISSGKAEGFW